MQGQSMSRISCFWQMERTELIQGRGCSPVLAKTSLCQIWSHSTCRRAPFLIWGPLWTELPPTALKELSLPFEFKICILWINMLYFHLLQALPSPETIRRKDFQIETLKTWQECYEIWFSFFHCLMFLQERFNTWHRCSETFAVASKTSPPGLIRLNTNSRCINLKILVLNIFSTDRVWSPSWDMFSGWF